MPLHIFSISSHMAGINKVKYSQVSDLVCIIITVISVFLDKMSGTWKWQEPVVIRYTYHRHIHHLLDGFCHTYFHAQLHNNPLFLPLVYHMVRVAVPSFFGVDHRILGFHSYYFWRSQYIWVKKDLQCTNVRIQICNTWKKYNNCTFKFFKNLDIALKASEHYFFQCHI